jgi:osmotically-inducible protein OsmY
MKADAQLQQDVMAELKWEPAVHAARCVVGVKSLAVEMTVTLFESGQRTDADIAGSAGNILSWTRSVPADAVKVLVESGWLTLSGDVEWHCQRQDAANIVRHHSGVTEVGNQIARRSSTT